MSEDPVDFAAYAIIEPAANAEARAALEPLWPPASFDIITGFFGTEWVNPGDFGGRLQFAPVFERAVREEQPFPLVDRLAWEEAECVREGPPRWAREIVIVQSSLYPGLTASKYCGKHDLHYGGGPGCHVCRGFYRSVRDGRLPMDFAGIQEWVNQLLQDRQGGPGTDRHNRATE